MKKTVRIGTRGSKLALYQAYRVKDALDQQFPEIKFEIVIIKTKGDKILDVPLSKIGDKGLFTKELEVAMFNNETDMAVHSLKDLPTTFPAGTKLGAVLERADASDALVSRENKKLSELTSSDVIATSSLRRKAQLLKMNRELNIVEIRGNVNTRIRKMEEGYCDAMIMAAAGLKRLEMDRHITEIIDPETIVPACGQGAIAIEIKDDDPETEAIISRINHQETMITTSAERAFLNALEGGCQIPVGSHSIIIGDQFHITGFVSNINGSGFMKESASGPVSEAKNIAVDLARKLADAGGKEILESIRKMNLAPGNPLPLTGKIFISTRAIDSGDKLPQMLENAGGKVIQLPMIQIDPALINDDAAEALSNLENYDWIIFTSKNGVVHFFRQMIEINGSTALPKGLKIATVGDKTAAELEYYGYAPYLSGSGNTSADLLEELITKYSPKGENFLLPLGNLAARNMGIKLSEENSVKRINVYNTVKPGSIDQTVLKKIDNNEYDLVLFTSPSTFNNFCSVFGSGLPRKLKTASIGTTTTAAMMKRGLEPVVKARKSNAEGLYESIIDYFRSQQD